MGKLSSYNFITLNGFFKGPGEDISWAKKGENEEKDFATQNLSTGNILLFGRKTYEMMAGYWPTEMAQKNDPIVAAGMNKSEKIVFSRSLKKADWNNTRIISNNIVEEIKKLKQEPKKNMTILGSGTIINLFAEKGLIDEFEIMVHPVVIGRGTPLFSDISQKMDLRLIHSKAFKSGVVLLRYLPGNN